MPLGRAAATALLPRVTVVGGRVDRTARCTIRPARRTRAAVGGTGTVRRSRKTSTRGGATGHTRSRGAAAVGVRRSVLRTRLHFYCAAGGRRPVRRWLGTRLHCYCAQLRTRLSKNCKALASLWACCCFPRRCCFHRRLWGVWVCFLSFVEVGLARALVARAPSSERLRRNPETYGSQCLLLLVVLYLATKRENNNT